MKFQYISELYDNLNEQVWCCFNEFSVKYSQK